MTAPATLAFVATPATSPTVTLNLEQPGLVKVLRDSFSLGAPEFEGDPYSGLGSYATRTVEMVLQVTGTYPEAAALAQQLARTLAQKRRSWLMLRWAGEAAPLFALVFPSSMREMEWENAGVGVWNLPVTLLCDAALYGPPETGSVTINNDPANATNPCFWSIGSAVKGDLETPLFLTLGPETTLSSRVFLIASSSLAYGLAQTSPYITQLPPASGWGVGSGFTTITGDAAMSGGNAYRFTSSGAPTTTSVSANSGQGVMAGNPIGDYRVFVRFRTNTVLGGQWSVTLIQQDSTGLFTNEGDAVRAGSTTGWLDLGVFRFPLGATTADPVFATTPAGATTRIQLRLQLGAGSAAGDTFDMDCLMFVPAGLDLAAATQLSFTEVPASVGAASASLVLDGPGDDEYVRNAAGAVGAMQWPKRVGGLPSVVPGCDNSLTLLRTVNKATVSAADTLTATTSLNWTYWPRYLYMRPSAS